MADWPNKHNGPCACRFVRREEFGKAEQVEWCGLHAKQRDVMDALIRASREAADVLRRDADILRDCHTINGQWDEDDRETQDHYDKMMALADRLVPASGGDEHPR